METSSIGTTAGGLPQQETYLSDVIPRLVESGNNCRGDEEHRNQLCISAAYVAVSTTVFYKTLALSLKPQSCQGFLIEVSRLLQIPHRHTRGRRISEGTKHLHLKPSGLNRSTKQLAATSKPQSCERMTIILRTIAS